MAVGQTEIYTAKMGNPPVDDEGPTMPSKPKKQMGQAEIYTAKVGNPPMDDEGPTKTIKKMKKFSAGGTASSRADGCAERGKTRGTMVSMCGGGMYKK
jgi:hypothetical protein